MTQQDESCTAFVSAFLAAAQNEQLIKLIASKPTKLADELKSCDIRPVMVKRKYKISFTYHYKTRDIVKNYFPDEAVAELEKLLSHAFKTTRLHTLDADFTLSFKHDSYQLAQLPPSQMALPTLTHDRAKHRLLDSGDKPYFHALGLADAHGKIHKNAHDKFGQINKYIEILDGLLKQLPSHDTLRIVDMGAGKGYLTFALYDYITNTLSKKARITGVEYRQDLVDKCNAIAKTCNFEGLDFEQGTIADFDCSGADVVIALHACDTATDDALGKAIHADAALIVVAPCCHKQIRREMRAATTKQPLEFLMKYGTYQDRIAEMVTDGMRGQLLELSGYQTNLFEFISDAHTPKNMMIVGIKSASAQTTEQQTALQTALADTKSQFGISTHELEKLLGRA